MDFYKLHYGENGEKLINRVDRLPHRYPIATLKINDRTVSALLDFKKDIVVFEYRTTTIGIAIIQYSKNTLHGTPDLASMEATMFSVLNEFASYGSPHRLNVSHHYKSLYIIKREQLDGIVDELYLQILGMTSGTFDFKISSGFEEKDKYSNFSLHIYYEENEMTHKDMCSFFEGLIQDILKDYDYELWSDW